MKRIIKCVYSTFSPTSTPLASSSVFTFSTITFSLPFSAAQAALAAVGLASSFQDVAEDLAWLAVLAFGGDVAAEGFFLQG